MGTIVNLRMIVVPSGHPAGCVCPATATTTWMLQMAPVT